MAVTDKIERPVLSARKWRPRSGLSLYFPDGRRTFRPGLLVF